MENPPKTDNKQTVTQEFLYDIAELVFMLERIELSPEVRKKSNDVFAYLMEKTETRKTEIRNCQCYGNKI